MNPMCCKCNKESKIFAESNTMVWLECPKCGEQLVLLTSDLIPKPLIGE